MCRLCEGPATCRACLVVDSSRALSAVVHGCAHFRCRTYFELARCYFWDALGSHEAQAVTSKQHFEAGEGRGRSTHVATGTAPPRGCRRSSQDHVTELSVPHF